MKRRRPAERRHRLLAPDPPQAADGREAQPRRFLPEQPLERRNRALVSGHAQGDRRRTRRLEIVGLDDAQQRPRHRGARVRGGGAHHDDLIPAPGAHEEPSPARRSLHESPPLQLGEHPHPHRHRNRLALEQSIESRHVGRADERGVCPRQIAQRGRGDAPFRGPEQREHGLPQRSLALRGIGDRLGGEVAADRLHPDAPGARLERHRVAGLLHRHPADAIRERCRGQLGHAVEPAQEHQRLLAIVILGRPVAVGRERHALEALATQGLQHDGIDHRTLEPRAFRAHQPARSRDAGAHDEVGLPRQVVERRRAVDDVRQGRRRAAGRQDDRRGQQ